MAPFWARMSYILLLIVVILRKSTSVSGPGSVISLQPIPETESSIVRNYVNTQSQHRCATYTVQVCYVHSTGVLRTQYRCATYTVQVCYVHSTGVLRTQYRCATYTAQVCYFLAKCPSFHLGVSEKYTWEWRRASLRSRPQTVVQIWCMVIRLYTATRTIVPFYDIVSYLRFLRSSSLVLAAQNSHSSHSFDSKAVGCLICSIFASFICTTLCNNVDNFDIILYNNNYIM